MRSQKCGNCSQKILGEFVKVPTARGVRKAYYFHADYRKCQSAIESADIIGGRRVRSGDLSSARLIPLKEQWGV